MRRLCGLVSFACVLALAAAPALGGPAQGVTSHIGSPGSTVAAADWVQMPNMTTGAPTGTDPLDNAVSCVNANFCLAVGVPLELVSPPFSEEWNGTTWLEVSLPTIENAPGANVQLTGISCVTTQFCVAVGNAVISHVETPLIEQWNGSAWSVVQDTSTLPATAGLDGVSCTSVSFCMAVGGTNGSPASTLVEQWNGATWSTSVLAVPTGVVETFAYGVSCAQPTVCMAVGTEGVTNPETQTVIGQGYAASWNGSAWTPVALPTLNSVPDAIFHSVSCIGPSFCAADGSAGQAGGKTAAAIWNGTAWTPATLPALPSTGFLWGMSCISTTSCTAVGQFAPAPGSGPAFGTLVFTWNGETWTQQLNTPDQTGSSDTFYTDVDCLADWACVAVGTYETGSGQFLPFNASASIARSGYRFVAADGGIFNYGASFYGSLGGTKLNAPIVGMATMPAGDGYYLVASDGGVFGYGSAQFYGSMGGKHLNRPIVGMAVTADGSGYWLVASDGGIFSFGDATFDGSMGGHALVKPIVGIGTTPNGNGYYEVASDGGIFAYGGAAFEGSMGGQHLNKPIVGMSVNSAGQYYLVASDGGIFAFGGAGFGGSTGSIRLAKPIVGMTTTSGGYYLGAADGGVFAFATALGGTPPPFLGSMGGQRLNAPIVGISS